MSELLNVTTIFGEDVFNDTVMQERLPKKVYKNLKRTIEEGKELDLVTADVIAHEMKEWAIEKGATHYTRCQCSCCRNEGLGSLKRSNALYALVPAAYRSHGREARFLYLSTAAQRQGIDELFR